MDLGLLVLAAVSFAVSFGLALGAIRKPSLVWAQGHFVGMFGGFLVLTLWLYRRGLIERSCPLNSLFDVLVFLAWSVVLIALLVGPVYRLSLMGAFTSPLALGLLLVGLLAPISREPVPRDVPNPWVELHAAVSLIAYGCFGLACVAGGMYLLQERQLKSGRFSTLLQSLPPISLLATANRRLLAWGLGLLTVSFGAGLASGAHVHGVKFLASLVIWFAYAAMLGASRLWPMPAGRFAAASVAVFGAALVSLPAIQHFSAAR